MLRTVEQEEAAVDTRLAIGRDHQPAPEDPRDGLRIDRQALRG
jgi:hypothetical protein